MRPIILVTTDRRDAAAAAPGPRVRPKRPEVWVAEPYLDAVRAAGGEPLLVPPGADAVDTFLGIADGVVLTGGAFDIHPSHYGEAVTGRLDRVEESRTSVELRLARGCLTRRIPILGVCGGMQALAVAAGGALHQHIPDVFAGALDHEQPTDPAEPWHDVHIEGPARAWLGASARANSTHHQAVKDAGVGLVICGWSPDGVPEVLASDGGSWALGVQWHPEILGDIAAYDALLEAVNADLSRRGRARVPS